MQENMFAVYLKDCFSDYKSKNNVFDAEIHMKMFILTFYLHIHICAHNSLL